MPTLFEVTLCSEKVFREFVIFIKNQFVITMKQNGSFLGGLFANSFVILVLLRKVSSSNMEKALESSCHLKMQIMLLQERFCLKILKCFICRYSFFRKSRIKSRITRQLEDRFFDLFETF